MSFERRPNQIRKPVHDKGGIRLSLVYKQIDLERKNEPNENIIKSRKVCRDESVAVTSGLLLISSLIRLSSFTCCFGQHREKPKAEKNEEKYAPEKIELFH